MSNYDPLLVEQYGGIEAYEGLLANNSFEQSQPLIDMRIVHGLFAAANLAIGVAITVASKQRNIETGNMGHVVPTDFLKVLPSFCGASVSIGQMFRH